LDCTIYRRPCRYIQTSLWNVCIYLQQCRASLHRTPPYLYNILIKCNISRTLVPQKQYQILRVPHPKHFLASAHRPSSSPCYLLLQWFACRVRLKPDGTRWRTGGEVKGKLANGVGSQYPSHRFTLPRNLVYPPSLPLTRTPRLPVVDWTDAPADLNGLVRFGERRSLVSARVPPRFKRTLSRQHTIVTRKQTHSFKLWNMHFSVFSCKICFITNLSNLYCFPVRAYNGKLDDVLLAKWNSCVCPCKE